MQALHLVHVSGVALSLVCRTCSCCTVALPTLVEIKTHAGELSDPQQSVMAAVLASGGRVGVVRDAEEMLGLLDAWGIPRARRLVLCASVAA
jgi:hypothetical protein